jgi:hypothetical protein
MPAEHIFQFLVVEVPSPDSFVIQKTKASITTAYNDHVNIFLGQFILKGKETCMVTVFIGLVHACVFSTISSTCVNFKSGDESVLAAS